MFIPSRELIVGHIHYSTIPEPLRGIKPMITIAERSQLCG